LAIPQYSFYYYSYFIFVLCHSINDKEHLNFYSQLIILIYLDILLHFLILLRYLIICCILQLYLFYMVHLF